MKKQINSLFNPQDLTNPPLELDVYGEYDWDNQTRINADNGYPVATASTSYSTSTSNSWDSQNDLDTNM